MLRHYLNSSLKLKNLKMEARFRDGSRTQTQTGGSRTNTSLSVYEPPLVYIVECCSSNIIFQYHFQSILYNINRYSSIRNIPHSIFNIFSYSVQCYSTIKNIPHSISFILSRYRSDVTI